MAEERRDRAPPAKVYVSNLSRNVRERDLYKLFEEIGRVENIVLKGRFAFVEFERSRSCEEALKEYDGIDFMGTRMRVEPYQYRGGDVRYGGDPRNDRRNRYRRGYDDRGYGDRRGGGGGYRDRGPPRQRRDYSQDYALFIYGLDDKMSWQDLKDFGRTAGRSVTFANVDRMRNGESEGVIKYSEKEDFENALKELDGTRLNGNKISVFERPQRDEFESNRGRDRGRDRKRSMSRSRSVSRSRSRDKRKRERSRSVSRSRSMSSSESGSYSREKKEVVSEESKENKQSKLNAKQKRSASRSRSVSRSGTPVRELKEKSKSLSLTPSTGFEKVENIRNMVVD